MKRRAFTTEVDEAIARLKSDLILGDSRQNEDEYTQLSQIAPTLLALYEWQEPC